MTDILVSDFITGLLVFLRITGMMFAAPVFGSSTFPTMAKLVLALVMTYIIFFMVEDYQFQYDKGLIMLALLGIKEVITGLIMGFVVQFIFYAINYAGMLIGFDLGLGMAMAFDVNTEVDTNLMGQVINTFALLVFVLIDGHQYLIRAVGFSFEVIPLGEYVIKKGVIDTLILYSGSIFILAVKMASPLMVSFFLLHIASGIMARISPQMNVFFVIHPLKMGMGFALLSLIAPVYVYIIRNLLENYENKLFEIVQELGK